VATSAPQQETAPPPTTPPETPPASLGLDLAALPRCDAIQAGVCRVIGTYALSSYMGMRSVLDVWPTLILPDGDTLMLESIWFKDRRPTQDIIDRLEGKLVEVIGDLHAMPPKNEGTRNLMAPCLSPIHAIRVLGDAP
jgi:hypothetical protein